MAVLAGALAMGAGGSLRSQPGPARGGGPALADTSRAGSASAVQEVLIGDARPAAVIYHRPQDKGSHYYTVHNGLEIAEVQSGGTVTAVEMAHVGAWDTNATMTPHPEVFWVCVNPASKSCPAPKKTTWFLRRLKVYPASKGKFKTGYAIAFNVPTGAHKGTHNGAFACWNPPKTKGCGKWPGNNMIFKSKGSLIVLHYVNYKTGKRWASKSHLSDFRFESERLKDPVSAQRISYLLCPKGCSSPS